MHEDAWIPSQGYYKSTELEKYNYKCQWKEIVLLFRIVAVVGYQ